MLYEQAKRIASLGHKVRVYNSCGDFEGFYDNVEYLKTDKFYNLECDVLVVSRRADALSKDYNINAKLKLLWVHDVCVINARPEFLERADKILALTEWHKQNLIKVHNLDSDKIIVTRNGIDLNRFNKEVFRNKYRCINSSSPNRSWNCLLDCWGNIKEKVKDAELHLFYGFKTLKLSAFNNPEELKFLESLEKRVESMRDKGVFFHGRVNQNILAEEFLKSSAWIHPTWFSETSCITAMEAQAAGLRMVTSNLAALKETVSSRGILIDGDIFSKEYKDIFTNSVIEVLNNDDEGYRQYLKDYAKQNFCLDLLAKQWEEMFFTLLK